jgi:predicted phospho-2-dehydro-3-deoxyheptonate aldolase
MLISSTAYNRYGGIIMNGKQLRLRRIMNARVGKTVIVPMDHGVSLGPVQGIATINNTIKKVCEGGGTCIVVHKGIARQLHPDIMGDLGLIVHLSASTSLWTEPNRKTLVGDVLDAVRLGADAVSVHVNLGGKYENEMMAQMGEVSSQCIEFGMPLLAMMYPRGENVKDQFDIDAIKKCARVGAELGADIVKTNYTGDIESFKEVVKGTSVPVVIAGGPKMDSEKALLDMVGDAMKAGAAGVSIGRNVFQHEDIVGITKKLAEIVFSG